ncbi:unnamed protein product [Acanthosepion pharaonis]|uniref:Uncharacterized protein n=1 Tax=Acanthosepion pharaonis TaxID=158019 RepID=A0A812DUQ4_ACAPH|nr:unnamed protein product [Sepia pharaonis]
MLTGPSEEPQNISDPRKTAVINGELKRLHVDIASQQETQRNEPRQHGVDFAVRNSLLNTIEQGSNVSDETPPSPTQHHRRPGHHRVDEFYDKLAATIICIPSKNQLVLLGDSTPVWVLIMTLSLGQFGVGKIYENGQTILELCIYHNLRTANSFFRTKTKHKVSWTPPHSKHWHQLDLILVRRAAIKTVLYTRSHWCAAISNTSPRVSTAVRSRGILALMSVCQEV